MNGHSLRLKVFAAVCEGWGFDPEDEEGFMYDDYLNSAWNIVDSVCDVPEISGLVE